MQLARLLDLECAGRAKRRRRFVSDKLQFVASLSLLNTSRQTKVRRTIQSGVALRLPPHSKVTLRYFPLLFPWFGRRLFESILGTCFAPSSALKYGSSLNPNSFAEITVGKLPRVVL